MNRRELLKGIVGAAVAVPTMAAMKPLDKRVAARGFRRREGEMARRADYEFALMRNGVMWSQWHNSPLGEEPRR